MKIEKITIDKFEDEDVDGTLKKKVGLKVLDINDEKNSYL